MNIRYPLRGSLSNTYGRLKIENLKMAVHTGSPKQGQWGQQGQTPNFSHTHARYN